VILTDLTLTDDGTVQVNFGPASMILSVDAAYDFQFQLAEFLADLEQKEDAEFAAKADAIELECSCEEAQHDNLLTLSHYRPTTRTTTR
jgi:hypothetical protein